MNSKIMTEKIKFEVTVDIRYKNKSTRKECIRDAKQILVGGRIGGIEYLVQPVKAKMIK